MSGSAMVDVPQGMIEAKRRAEQELLARPGVVGVGVGFAESGGEPTDVVAIKVYVEPGHEVASRLPPEIEGHPVSVVERRIVPLHQTLEPESTGVEPDTDSYDPLVGGISIGPCRSPGEEVHVGGTLGAVVIDKASGKPMLLSNYHVLAINGGWKAGDDVAQPSLPDKTLPLCTGVVGSLARAKLGGSVDCAVATQTDLDFDWSIHEIGPVSGTATPRLGLAVSKRGCTTRLTHGTISATDVVFSADYPYGVGRVTLMHQIEVRPSPLATAFCDHGDSGSLVVNDAGAAVGLLIAKTEQAPVYGYANPIAAVTAALGVAVPSSDEVPSLHNKQTLTDRASGAPVLASAEGRPLTMAFAGTNGAINIQTSTDGVKFANKTVLPQKTFTEPALVLAPAGSGRADYIAWRGSDSNNTLNIASLGPNWSITTHYTLDERSDANPALAFHEGVLVLAWKGHGNDRLNIATSGDGGKTFPNKLEPPQSSPHGPWLCKIDQDLYLVWQGGDNNWPNIAQITSVSPLQLSFPTVINSQRTSYHPSLALAGELLLAWRGTDSHSRINVALSRQGMNFNRQVTFVDSTAASPMLCTWSENLYIAWTGTDDDHHVNFAELTVPADG